MIRINSTNETTKTGKSRKTAGSSKPFAASAETARTARGPSPEAAASPSALSALIGLQSRKDGSARSFIAAQQTLDALAELQRAIVTGGDDAGALGRLQGLCDSLASVKQDDGLAAITAEIRLRAEVEIAKRSRKSIAAQTKPSSTKT